MPAIMLVFFMQKFSLTAQLKSELNDFFNESVIIASPQKQDDVKYVTNKSDGYSFNQWYTLNLAKMYYHSRFESGQLDENGMEKLFLNIGRFRCDVAAKQVDLDVKDFVFIPEENNSAWGAFFLGKEFSIWSKEKEFGQVINDLIQDYVKYGSAVIRRTKDGIERVSLFSIRVDQDAKSLKEAEYVIIEHDEMDYDQMKKMKNWDISGLQMEFGKEFEIYERWGKVPLSFYKEHTGDMEIMEEDDYEGIETMAIIAKECGKDGKESVLFMEQVDERPFEEVHWSREDGRWLGIGEMEIQFPNQIAKNFVVDMERRSLHWSGKRIFQSSDTELPKNLVRNVKDGEVLNIMPNGQVTQVDMSSRATGEFNNFMQIWETNSDQKSFTFESVTGESLPSGTPFRLGALVSNAANSHFALKRENLGLFFQRVVNNQLLEVFKKERRPEALLSFGADEEGFETMKQTLVKNQTNAIAREQLLNGILPDIAIIEDKVKNQLNEKKRLFVERPERFWDGVKASARLVITGENVNLDKKIETYTNVYNVLAQRNDPRAEVVLEKLLALTGENFEAMAGVRPQENQTPVQAVEQQFQGLPAVPQQAQV